MKNIQIYKNKVALITGCGQGIGRALSIKLAQCGAIVICTDRNKKFAQDTVNEINDSIEGNFKAVARELDVTSSKQLAALMIWLIDSFKRIDFLFNNAGVNLGGEIRDLSEHHWRDVLDINLFGHIQCATQAYKQMITQKMGHIVNVTSISGILDYTPLSSPYSVSKHGAVAFSKALELEAKDFNIKVTTICPGSVKTSIGENMVHINANDNAKKNAIDFINKGISSNEAAKIILKGVAKGKNMLIFPASFKSYYWLTRIFKSIEIVLALKMIRSFRKTSRLNSSEEI